MAEGAGGGAAGRGLRCRWDSAPLLPQLERSCSDCGAQAAQPACRQRRQGKFRRVLSETWNYPSWLFVEPADNSSSDSADLETARDCGAEIVVVECSPAPRHAGTQDDSDSEDEGWYSLSRTDVRKLQEVRGRQDVNIILTNPDIDILHLCAEDEEEDVEEDLEGEDERKQESSPERTSYSSLSSGDSGQGSDGSKPSSRKSSDPGSSGCSCSASSEDHSSDTSCDNEDSCAHKITVFVKYNEGASVPALVEGCVDSEGEGEAGGGGGDTVVTCDTRGDTITICDTRVRLRLCAAPGPGQPALRASRRLGSGRAAHFVPVKRKDLFKLLGLNESSAVLDPTEEADAKKVALQNFLCTTDKSDNTAPRRNGILLAPKQGKKNLAKFLGIDMSALAEAGVGEAGEPALDCESVSLSSTTTTSTGGGGGARHRGGGGLRALLPRTRRLEAASPDTAAAGHQDAEIPEQLRAPAVPQANRKDLQRFLGLNDSEEMVYIRNVRKPFPRHRQQSQDCLSCGPSTGGTISSVCSCVVCTQEYAPAPAPAPLPGQDTEPGPEVRLEHSNSSLEHSNSGNSSMVEHNCGNNKCIMCGPAPPQRTQEADTATVRVAVVSPSLHNNNNNNNSSSSSVVEQSSVGSRPQVAPPPPLPKKTVAPYQEYKFGLEDPMPSMADQSAAAGRDKRRKKQATKRMEQLIKIHTENVDLSDAGEQLQLVRTLDRSEAGAGGGAPRGRRLHKRSILKQQKQGGESSRPASLDIRPRDVKVKFAGSLRKRDQAKMSRRKVVGPPCQVHFPWQPDYLDMRHLLAVVDPRYLAHLHK